MDIISTYRIKPELHNWCVIEFTDLCSDGKALLLSLPTLFISFSRSSIGIGILEDRDNQATDHPQVSPNSQQREGKQFSLLSSFLVFQIGFHQALEHFCFMVYSSTFLDEFSPLVHQAEDWKLLQNLLVQKYVKMDGRMNVSMMGPSKERNTGGP